MPPVVLQLISSGGFYGAERVLVALADHARAQGWESILGVLESPGADMLIARARRLGLEHERLPGALTRPLAIVRALQDCLARRRVDLVHSHGYKPDVLMHWTRLPRPIKRLATCHSWYSTSLKLRFYEWLDKRALKRFDHVVAVSEEILSDLRGEGIAPERSSLILNGVALDAPSEGFDRRRLRAEMGAGDADALILRLGRLAPSKGNRALLRAVAGLPRSSAPPWRLALVGEGKERSVLEREARALGIGERVRFAGFRVDTHDLLRAADAMVIPSTQEGLPIVLLEAMAAGTPVVSTAVGQIPRVIQDGRNGWLAPPGDPERLGVAIGQALANPDEARRRASVAQADYAATFSQEAMGRAYMELYRSLLAGRQGA
jgi:glycosyltransferase involved in cell wall biosynthesis